MTLRRADVTTSLALIPAVVFALSAQTQAPSPASQSGTIKSEVRIVLVDVVVTDGNRTVAGLRKDAFQVTEDGRPQTISFFEEHTGGKVLPAVLPPMPPDVYTNYPTIKTTDSLNVLLLDSLNTQATDQVYVRPQMVKYLQTELAAPTGARLAIFTLGQTLHMVRGFTADSHASLDALLDSKSGTEAKFEPQTASPWRIVNENRACDGIRSPAGQEACKDMLSEERSDRAGDRVSMTLQAFQALARYLSQFPGRKNVMWISGSFPLNFFPESRSRGAPYKKYTTDIRQTADLLTADQVAVYPISARGLTAEEYTNPGYPLHDGSTDGAFDQIAMETLARDSGGKAFYNTNGLDRATAEAIDTGSHYYTLTYTPTNLKMDSKFRRIEVKAKNTSFKLSYRRGYYAEKTTLAPAAGNQVKTDPLAPLMAFGMPDFAEILFKVQLVKATPVNDHNAAATNAESKPALLRYFLDFAISAQDLALESSPDGVRHGNIEFMAVAYDPAGAALNSIRKKSEVVLNPQAYHEVIRSGLQMRREIEVPVGRVFLRAGIYDLNSGKAGSLGIWIGDQK
jgi:VWFA-related protein